MRTLIQMVWAAVCVAAAVVFINHHPLVWSQAVGFIALGLLGYLTILGWGRIEVRPSEWVVSLAHRAAPQERPENLCRTAQLAAEAVLAPAIYSLFSLGDKRPVRIGFLVVTAALWLALLGVSIVYFGWLGPLIALGSFLRFFAVGVLVGFLICLTTLGSWRTLTWLSQFCPVRVRANADSC